MTDIYAEDFHLSERAFNALRSLRDRPAETSSYQASLAQLLEKHFARETSTGYRLTTQGEMLLALGPEARKQLANASAVSLHLLAQVVAHRGTLPAAQADNRTMRAIGPDSKRRWVQQRLGEDGMVVEATAQGQAIAQLVTQPLVQSEDPEEEKLLIAVRNCQPFTTLFPALTRGAPLDTEDLPELYQLCDLGYAELVAATMAPPPRRDAERFRGSPVWRFTTLGARKAQLHQFPVPEPPPTTPDPVQPLPLGSGQTLRALVQGEDLMEHDEHRLRDLEVLRLVERVVPDDPEQPRLWRPTTAGVVLATIELHAQPNAEAVETGIPEPGHEATVEATFGPSATTH